MVIALEVWVEEGTLGNGICDVIPTPYSAENEDSRAGIVVYIPSKQENLWDIGKEYGISLKAIKDINGLMEVEDAYLPQTKVEKGEKLLLVRG